MNPIETLHGSYVHGRRVARLTAAIAAILPAGASVLDVGAGDGLLAGRLKASDPSLQISGIDVMVRPDTHVPVVEFNGTHIPHPDQAFDYVMFVDVLHHTEDPKVLLAEAARVMRKGIVIKDHLLEGALAARTLRLMDDVGNRRHNVALPHNYWSLHQWRQAFTELGLEPAQWNQALHLYPFPADLIFGRSLHFLALLETETR